MISHHLPHAMIKHRLVTYAGHVPLWITRHCESARGNWNAFCPSGKPEQDWTVCNVTPSPIAVSRKP